MKWLSKTWLNCPGALQPHPGLAGRCDRVSRAEDAWPGRSPSGVLCCPYSGAFPWAEGKHFGSGEKLVGSTICRLRTGAGAARCARVRRSQEKQGLKAPGGKAGSGRAVPVLAVEHFQGVLSQPAAVPCPGRRETRGAGARYRWECGDNAAVPGLLLGNGAQAVPGTCH